MPTPMMEKLKLGVIGAGVFGSYHASKCSAHGDVDFIGVYDQNLDASRLLAGKFDVDSFASNAELFDRCDGVIIAAPAISHGGLALAALKSGLHVLVEKPLATTKSEAREALKLAHKMDKCVQLGHQERFVGRAIGLDKVGETPILIQGHRLNPFSVRGTDTSVTLDLMTHDIDLVHWLMGAYPNSVSGKTYLKKTHFSDRSLAHLIFDQGEAFLEASRLAETGSRIMEISYPSGTVIIDFNKKSLIHDTPFKLNENFADHPEAKDSLAAGLDEFVKAIKEKRPSFIPVEAGYKAVEVALKIDGEI